MSKIYYSDKQIRGFVHSIIRQMNEDKWKPDYIVGLTRGGLIPATMLSHYLNVPMETLKVSLRDGGETESNCWMAEDAYGYIPSETIPRPAGEETSDSKRRKNILIVDDINDSGNTLQWIKDDWKSSCLPHSEDWNDVWHHNVQFAVLIENTASNFKGVDYCGTEINKFETPVWCVFPWEVWWEQ